MHGLKNRPSNNPVGRPPRPMSDRFWEKVDTTGECWLWLANLSKSGYGQFGGPPTFRAHRFAYEDHVGPIPEGMELDHLCGVKACVRPSHLDPVTPAEHRRREGERKTHCRQGHEYTPSNTYRAPKTRARGCKTCRATRSAAHRKNKKARPLT